eukprot:sb/3478198/
MFVILSLVTSSSFILFDNSIFILRCSFLKSFSSSVVSFNSFSRAAFVLWCITWLAGTDRTTNQKSFFRSRDWLSANQDQYFLKSPGNGRALNSSNFSCVSPT